MNSLALSGLDYRKPFYFGGGGRGRGKRHNQPLEPQPAPPGAVGGSGSSGGGSGGASSALPVGAVGGSGESGSGFTAADGRDGSRDCRDPADTNQSQPSIIPPRSAGGGDQLDLQDPGSEDASAQCESGENAGDSRYRGKYRSGSGAVAALFGARQTIAEGHLPPWLLPGYGADGTHWPAGTPPDSQMHMRNWKKCWNKEPDPDQESRPFANDVAASKYENVVTHPPMELDPAELLDQPHDCNKAGCQRVIINVSGQRYETQLRTLNRFPGTLLGDPMKRKSFWDSRRNEFFIDRHRPSFQAILYYYQSGGRLRRPIEVPEDIFLEELEFYEFDEETIKEYKENEGFLMDEVKPMPTNKYFKAMWMFVEEPDSSRAARVFAVISVACIMVSIINFCLETLPNFERKQCVNVTTDGGLTYHNAPNYSDVFFIIESICVAWFTVEFIIRAITCPSKFQFSKNIMNIFDVMAILPYFITLITIAADSECHSSNKGGSFVFIRVLRVFRIFKLGKHSQGLRILGLTIKSSLRELGMFFFFLIVAMVIFSSAAYYAEAGEPDSQLTSIPGAFWWAIVTMTTVGYGDVTPVGVWGKMVGSICVIAGVLTIALPVPVVVANFNNFYRRGSGSGGGVG